MEATKKDKLHIEYDEAKDIVTIEGVMYSGEFFRWFADPLPDSLIRVTKQDGIVKIQRYYDGI